MKGSNEQLDEILEPEAVAKILKIDTGTLANWRVKGSGPIFFRLGGLHSRVRYYRRDVAAWLQSRTRITPIT